MPFLVFRDPDEEESMRDMAPLLDRMGKILRANGYEALHQDIYRGWAKHSEDDYAAGFMSVEGLSDESILKTLLTKCHLSREETGIDWEMDEQA